MTTSSRPLTPQQEGFRAWAERNLALARQRDAQGLPELAFDAREEVREARRLTRARQAGHTHSKCSRCGKTRVLSWAGGHCNEWADNDEQMCGGIYRATGES